MGTWVGLHTCHPYSYCNGPGVQPQEWILFLSREDEPNRGKEITEWTLHLPERGSFLDITSIDGDSNAQFSPVERWKRPTDPPHKEPRFAK